SKELERFGPGKSSCSLNYMPLSKCIRQQLQCTEIRPRKIENGLTPSVPLQKTRRSALVFTDGIGIPVKTPQCPERHLQQEQQREVLHRKQEPIAFHQHHSQGGISTETCGMAVVNHS